MPVMRAGWGQGTDAVQCCVDMQELEDLLKGRSVKTSQFHGMNAETRMERWTMRHSLGVAA